MELSFKKLLTNIIGIAVLGCCSSFAAAGIIYSGERNISFTLNAGDGILNPVVDLGDDIANDWDNLQFDLISLFGGNSFGSSTSWVGAPVAMGFNDATFPNAERYAEGEFFDGFFGSGSAILWRFDEANSQDSGLYRNTSGYAALLLDSFSANPLQGWINLSVNDYKNESGSGTTLTVIDWAYETTGQSIAFGEGRVSVPEPQSLVLFMMAMLGMVLVRKNQVRQ